MVSEAEPRGGRREQLCTARLHPSTSLGTGVLVGDKIGKDTSFRPSLAMS